MVDNMMSEKIDQLVSALIEVQKEVSPVKFDANNPFFNSQYATLGAVWEAYRLPLTKNGLAVSQLGSPAPDGHIGITTVLLHKSGQWLCGTLILPLKVEKKKDITDKDGGVVKGDEVDPHDPQKAGSAITYARRYALSALVMGVSEEDDDANQVSNKNKKEQTTSNKPTCPKCGKPAIIKGKEEYGGGYLCYKKIGGCGTAFDMVDGKIEEKKDASR